MKQFTEEEETTELGVKASTIDLGKIVNHPKPAQVRDEIPTLNQYGYMKFEFEHFSKSFVEIAAKASKPVLEIGCAFGWVTHRALEAGAKVVACDISREHLEVVVKEAPQEHLANLYLYQGAFPDEVDFAANSFEAILMSRILHFLDGETLERGLDKIHQWLAPNGKFIATNCSIYHSSVKGKMEKIFEERIAAKEKWAGMTQKSEYDSVHANYSPRFINVFYQEQLEELLPKHGFKIEEIHYFDYSSDPWPDEGKGHIGFIASKI